MTRAADVPGTYVVTEIDISGVPCLQITTPSGWHVATVASAEAAMEVIGGEL